MWTGVCTYSFAVGSLSSVLNTLDTKDAKLKKKLGVLEELRSQYELSHEIYSQLKKALKYDHSRDSTEKINFVNELPLTLKNELSVIMHKHLIRNIPFFSGKPPHFLAFAGPLLKSIKVSKGEYIYREEDPSTEGKFIQYIYIYIYIYSLLHCLWESSACTTGIPKSTLCIYGKGR